VIVNKEREDFQDRQDHLVHPENPAILSKNRFKDRADRVSDPTDPFSAVSHTLSNLQKLLSGSDRSRLNFANNS